MTRISLGRAVLRGTVCTALMVSLMSASALGAPVDLSKWSPQYVRSIAGTEDFDTAADCAKVTPLDYKGRLTFWYQGVFEGDPDLLRQYYKEFFETFRKTYPNIQLEEQALTYNDLLDKFRTALLGNAAPMAVRLQILGGTEFASKGYLQPLKPEDVGYSTEDFWPGAMKAVTWDGAIAPAVLLLAIFLIAPFLLSFTGYHGAMDQGMISERGFNHMLDCVIAMKEVLGDKVSLALDCGPGWMLPDAIKFARAVEKYNLMWLEDMLTGDYVPWVNPQAYRELTTSTSTPIHTGEQIYLRHNFKELIETQAVRVIGPDPADIGGIAELKWVAEHAYMHSILMAPHGTANGLLGLGALINVCATLPANYVAFEYPSASDPWWEDLVIGLPPQIVKDSMVDLLEAPGLGLDIDAQAARRYLREEDAGFFD